MSYSARAHRASPFACGRQWRRENAAGAGDPYPCSTRKTSRAARRPLDSAPATVPISAPFVASPAKKSVPSTGRARARGASLPPRSEEHTSELQSPYDLVCRILLEKKKQQEVQLQNKKKKRKSINQLI